MFLRHLSFCPDFLAREGKRLNKKAKTNFKIYDVMNWETDNTIHIVPNVLRSKGNQTMKVGQFVTREIFFSKNHTQNEVEKLISDLFLKNQN